MHLRSALLRPTGGKDEEKLLLKGGKDRDDNYKPPNNRLEALKGNRQGQHSIRINNRWRVCFVWRGGHAHEVEIVDYH